MPNKFRESLEALSADEVTEKLGDLCEKMDALMADRTKGAATTLFNAVALSLTESRDTLANAAAKKNGVTYNGSDFEAQLAAIADAAEARGSQSATKIRQHVELMAQVKKAANDKGYKETLNPLDTARYALATIKAFKNR